MNSQNISDSEEDDTVFTFSSAPRALPPDARAREDEFRLQSRGNATTPIQHLPNEIMSEIFMFWAYGGGPSRGRTARHLSTVCTGWRNIAITDPRLWTHPNLIFRG
ncbi:uncharacterized protein STEHIDRAFT_118907 [Stereum hirsutum FP-91666 SS1]|uniref:uncharacterized protein n=1 Tax=Stereum hirsutum (strain FP-91666) TaxID=721885 RepID=UPI000440A627|nr:uncharacterized protein STEHIDRAFT_118907 [Stereum hirsutum FP-91666 SS1]EIM89800.1 hypothetical protein STEHIDRAFT_118907 [Stereum hirsutum FP-91666 SS1]